MKKSTKLYVIYAAAVLAVGSAYMYFQHDREYIPTENGTVYVSDDNSSTGAESSSRTTVKTSSKRKSKTTRTTAVKTTTTKTVTETTVTEPEVLWFDINEANEEQLAKLPEIGEKLAAEIVSYRNSVGRFRNIEEIMNVSGIGEGKFEAIREYIYVIDPVYDIEQNPEEEPEQIQEETEHTFTLEEIAPLDLNKASKEELMLLPYVDEDIAQRIIDFREQAGGFHDPYELLYIEGLTQHKVAEILEYVSVEKNEELKVEN